MRYSTLEQRLLSEISPAPLIQIDSIEAIKVDPIKMAQDICDCGPPPDFDLPPPPDPSLLFDVDWR